MTRYSLLSLARNALTGHRRWTPAWRDAAPKPAYDVVIVGGGGHGLATAYYLASRYGVTNVAVLEKGWIGGGNTARNTTIVRSNYLLDDSAFLYEHSLKLWEGLTAELDFNVMFSQRGVVSLAHSAHELTSLRQRDRAMRLNGIDSDMLDLPALRRLAPALIADLDRLYQNLKGGDVLAIDYRPGRGSVVRLNTVTQTVDPGPALIDALLDIWMGPRALNPDIRAQLLSGHC